MVLRYHILHYFWYKQALIFKLSNFCISDRCFYSSCSRAFLKKSLPGHQSGNRLGWKNAVLDLSSILFIKSELHCRRFTPLCNSEIIVWIWIQNFASELLFLLEVAFEAWFLNSCSNSNSKLGFQIFIWIRLLSFVFNFSLNSNPKFGFKIQIKSWKWSFKLD